MFASTSVVRALIVFCTLIASSIQSVATGILVRYPLYAPPSGGLTIDRLLVILDAFLHDSRLYLILGMIFLDVALAVAEACKRQQFEWRRLGDFYMTSVIPNVIGYAALYLVFGYVAGLEAWLGQGLVTAAFLPLAAALVASIGAHLKEIGVTIPVPPLSGQRQ